MRRPEPTRVLHAGGLGLLGLSLPELLHGQVRAAAQPAGPASRSGRAKSCILLFLMGGPAQHSTWDPKPDTPQRFAAIFSQSPRPCLECNSAS